MLWQILDPDFAAFGGALPDIEGCAVSLCRVVDHRESLLGVEQEEIGSMVEKRQFGFSSGRRCAHLVQAQLGLEPQAVGRQDRMPIWPKPGVGSITHSDEVAAAIASLRHRGVGIDIEQTDRVDEKLYRILFTQAEQQNLNAYGFDAATVILSAKEAGYKSIFPIGRKFIGFQDAEIILNPENCSFTISYLGDHHPNEALNEGVGYWCEAHGHVLTVFVIP